MPPLITDPAPAFDLARAVLSDPTAPASMVALACATLAQSPEWTDVVMVRKVRTAFWTTPASEHGDNFNRLHARVSA